MRFIKILINIYLFMKKRRFCFIAFFISAISSSQENFKNFTTDSIDNRFKIAHKLINSNRNSDFIIGIEGLNKLQKDLEQYDNKDLLLSYYKNRANLLIENYHDFKNAEGYINKGFAILKNHPDNRNLGFFYELLGVERDAEKRIQERNAAFLNAEKYLSKYASKKDNIDINFNLAKVNKDKEQWDKVYYYATKSLNLIKETNYNVDRSTFLNLFLAESLLHLNKIPDAEEYLKKVENDKLFKSKNKLVLYRYYDAKGYYYEITKKLKEATENYKIGNYYLNLLNLDRVQESTTFQNLYAEMKFKTLINKKNIWEKEQNIKSIRYKNYILILVSITILILLIFIVLRYKNALFKNKMNNLLKVSNDDLEKSNVILEKTLRIKTNFINTSILELKKPLTTINKVANSINESESKFVTNENLQLLSYSSSYLLQLINNIINFNVSKKNVTDKLSITNNVNNLKELLFYIVHFFSYRDDLTKKVSLKIDDQIADQLLFDDFRIAQVFIKLTQNALLYITEGNIDINVDLISSNTNSNEICFTFKNIYNEKKNNVNYGLSINESSLDFELIKSILALYNSKLVAKTNDVGEQYVCFTINFISPQTLIKDNKDENLKNASQEKRKILLVEDNKINQFLTKKILTSNGFECDVANDGLEALNKANDCDYDLILMDIMMPVMDGFESSTEIKKIKPNIPIIALTAVSEEVNKERFDECGIIKVITKPVDFKLLCETINNFIK